MKLVLDYIISKDDVYNMSADELCRLLMYTDGDRKTLPVADKIYWWCVEEINRRLDCGEISLEGN